MTHRTTLFLALLDLFYEEQTNKHAAATIPIFVFKEIAQEFWPEEPIEKIIADNIKVFRKEDEELVIDFNELTESAKGDEREQAFAHIELEPIAHRTIGAIKRSFGDVEPNKLKKYMREWCLDDNNAVA